MAEVQGHRLQVRVKPGGQGRTLQGAPLQGAHGRGAGFKPHVEKGRCDKDSGLRIDTIKTAAPNGRKKERGVVGCWGMDRGGEKRRRRSTAGTGRVQVRPPQC